MDSPPDMLGTNRTTFVTTTMSPDIVATQYLRIVKEIPRSYGFPLHSPHFTDSTPDVNP